jgi:hypothetical protein
VIRLRTSPGTFVEYVSKPEGTVKAAIAELKGGPADRNRVIVRINDQIKGLSRWRQELKTKLSDKLNRTHGCGIAQAELSTNDLDLFCRRRRYNSHRDQYRDICRRVLFTSFPD